MNSIRVGILGLGIYLPPEVRRNDWWPAEVVARWTAAQLATPPRHPPDTITEGTRRVLRALAEQTRDPFLSTVERRVLPNDMTVFDMEEQASRAAIARAGVARGAIDLLLVQTIMPDQLAANPAGTLHRRLGLSPACFSMQTDASSSAFLMQLTLAESMIRAGRARCALLVQSCASSRFIDLSSPLAPLFGDIATAAVVGPVSSGRGIEAAVSYTDGRYPQTLIMSVPGGAWYGEGRAVFHVGDPQQNYMVFLESVDNFKQSVAEVLAASGHGSGEIDFVGIHQGTPWMRAVVQDYLGLSAARSIETFSQTGYVFASTLPVALTLAQDQQMIADDDLVTLMAGGSGTTYGAMIIRWGT